MAPALTAPFLVAALVLCVAGVAKLWRPSPATRALVTIGVPGGAWIVRAFAGGELVLGAWALLDPGPLIAAGVCVAYALLAAVSAALARSASGCGCFGSGDAPASPAQSLLSSAIAAVAALAVRWRPHGAGWVLGRPPEQAVAITAGLAGAAYAAVLVYTLLPAAWSAWSRA